MLQQGEVSSDASNVLWSVATLAARTGGTFAEVCAEITTMLGREPQLDEARDACRLAEEALSATDPGDTALGAWMILCRLTGRLGEAGIDLSS